MKIFIDIGHPAHVHYFRNFIKIMTNRGHEFLITARDKEVTHSLLNYYNIPYISRGKGRNGYLGKALYILEADYKLYKIAKKFNPDLFLSFGSAYAAHVSKLLGKPHIAFDDTDHAKYEHLLYVPFTDHIFTPIFYKKDFGKKHKRFNGIMELCYLSPRFLNFDETIQGNDRHIFIRLSGWRASHDFGYRINHIRIELVENVLKLSEQYSILISSEDTLPSELEKFRLSIHPAQLHKYLFNSILCLTEGGTIANECSLLGVPNILVNPIAKYVGVHQYLKNLGLQEYVDNFSEAFNLLNYYLVNIKNLNNNIKKQRDKFLRQSIDVNDFLINLVEQYPKSIK